MTKDDIKKALEICADISIPCNDCPYDAIGNCNDTLSADALKLIIEQEKEIERLQDKCEELRNEKWDAQDDLDCYCDEMPNKIKQAKIDVLNELKKRARTSYVLDDFILGSVVFSKDIDELIADVQNGKIY